MTETKDLVQPKPMQKKEKFFYGFGEMSSNIIWTLSISWILFFFTDVYMISTVSAATLLLIVRFYDAIKDPFVGLIVDRTNTKFGKARPYLLWFAIPFGICGILLFFTPDFSETGKVAYAYVMYFLLATFYSLVNVPYSTLVSLMTKDQHERTQLSRIRGIFNVFAALIVGMVPVLVGLIGFGNGYLEKQRTGYFFTALIFGVVSIAGFLLTFFFVQEHVESDESLIDIRCPIPMQMKALLKNDQWCLMFFMNMLSNMRMAILSGMSVYYIKYIAGLPEAYTSIAMILFVIGMLAGVLPGTLILSKFGYKKSLLSVSILGIAGCLITLVAPKNFFLIAIFCIVNGFAQGIPTVAGFAMLADVTEYGEWKTGIRSEGLIFSTYSFAQKFSTALGGFIIGIILALTDYHAGVNVQSPGTLTGIYYAYIGSLIVINLIRIVLIRFYKLEREKYSQIIKEIEERRTLKQNPTTFHTSDK